MATIVGAVLWEGFTTSWCVTQAVVSGRARSAARRLERVDTITSGSQGESFFGTVLLQFAISEVELFFQHGDMLVGLLEFTEEGALTPLQPEQGDGDPHRAGDRDGEYGPDE